jgi:hypothetical protein
MPGGLEVDPDLVGPSGLEPDAYQTDARRFGDDRPGGARAAAAGPDASPRARRASVTRVIVSRSKAA